MIPSEISHTFKSSSSILPDSFTLRKYSGTLSSFLKEVYLLYFALKKRKKEAKFEISNKQKNTL